LKKLSLRRTELDTVNKNITVYVNLIEY
jgi:hypothetical protein